MKRGYFIAAFILAFFTFGALGVHAAEAHTHCVCGTFSCTADSETKHADQKINEAGWQPWSGDLSVVTVTDETTEIYLYLEIDVTIKDTLNITNVTVHLCLNGKTLTIDKEGNPAVRVGENQKFVLCDCKGNGKITGAKGNAGDAATLRGTVNCQAGSNFIMYGGGIYVKGYRDNTAYPYFYTNIYDCDIHNNTATGDGGGMCLDGANWDNQFINLYDCKVRGNISDASGAAYLLKRMQM